MTIENSAVALSRPARSNSIHQAFMRAVQRSPEQIAIVFGARSWSYKALAEATDRVAAQLLAMGLRKGDRVAAYGRNSDAYLILWLACTRTGLVHVPVNYGLVARELDYILQQSGAHAIFHDVALAEKVDAVSRDSSERKRGTLHGGTGLDILSVATSPQAGSLADDELADETDLAQILYTSGTTSDPKGAMLTHAALMAEYVSSIIALEFKASDIALAALPLYHSAQMHVFTMPQLLLGATTFLIDAPAPDTCLAMIEELSITSFFAPPTVWISLLRHPDFDSRNLESLRYVYYGASIMPVPVLQELRRRLPGAAPFNCYGQSEIGPLATVLRPEEHEARPASAGRPIFNVETRVVDENMNDVPPGVPGEIIHRSPQLMSGYWNKPEETAEAFRDGWFHSGDVAVRDEEGYITLVDRVKDIIKTGGTMVASREVEEILFEHSAVEEVAVIGLPDEKWIEAVAAVVVLRANASTSPDELLAHARTRLAPFKLPKRFIFVDELPRNTAGKILKRELRDRFSEEAAS